ncbi:MAG: Trk system potassium transporter TrkA [Actinomycetota bacterium]|nr:Trk system potassium transporter TrkA [Actinomycetota bacterium]
MRIVIVGAGAVGSYLAERLSAGGQDVVVVEADQRRADALQDALDCLVVHGNGASPRVLAEAGIDKCDLLIAVSDNDEANVLACRAGTQAGVPTTLARVEDADLRIELEELGVDAVIDPGQTTAFELLRLIRRGGVSEIIEYGDGRLSLIGGHIQPGSKVAGATLAKLRESTPHWDWIVAVVVRKGATIVARGDVELQVGDHALVMTRSEQADEAINLLGFTPVPARRVMILGSTRLAELTTDLFLSEGIHVTVVEQDADRCNLLADRQGKALVICGDPTDPKVLAGADIDRMDAVLALTGWDEVNILSCLVAKALGVPTAVARFARVQYVGLLEGVGIDAAVSSRLAAANAILRYVRRGRVHSVVTFDDTDAEAIELEVGPLSPAAGRRVSELGLPRSTVLGGVVRGSEVFVPGGDSLIQPGDRLVVFTLPESIREVERLFG